MGPIQTLAELLGFLRRRLALITAVAFVVTVAAIAVALNTEHSYRAQAVIQVEDPSVSPEVTARAVPSNTARRLAAVEQRLMSRDNLLRLAREMDMFPGLTPQRRVTAMRRAISFEVVAAIRERAALGTDITSANRSRNLTVSVTEAFATNADISLVRVMTETGDPQGAAGLANTLARSIVAQNRSAATGDVESALDFYVTQQARIQDQIDTVSDEIVAFKSENFELLPEAMEDRREERAELREELLRTRREISALESEIAELSARGTLRATEQRRLNAAREEIEAARRTRDELAQQTAELDALTRRAPQVAFELEALEQREERLRDQAREIAERRLNAALGEELDGGQNFERFELLEAALPPDYPSSRSRKSMVMMGAIAGAVLGLLLAYAIEWLNPALRSASQMERELGMQPVMTLPRLELPGDRRRRAVGWAAGAALALLTGLALLTLRRNG